MSVSRCVHVCIHVPSTQISFCGYLSNFNALKLSLESKFYFNTAPFSMKASFAKKDGFIKKKEKGTNIKKK